MKRKLLISFSIGTLVQTNLSTFWDCDYQTLFTFCKFDSLRCYLFKMPILRFRRFHVQVSKVILALEIALPKDVSDLSFVFQSALPFITLLTKRNKTA